MDANTVINIIQSLGFPIVSCCAMGWFVFYMFNKNQEQIDTLTEQHRAEMTEMQQAIDNNTIALTQLIDTINYLKKEQESEVDENVENES